MYNFRSKIIRLDISTKYNLPNLFYSLIRWTFILSPGSFVYLQLYFLILPIVEDISIIFTSNKSTKTLLFSIKVSYDKVGIKKDKNR